ncbi:MAG: M50 family metallopeptidase [Lachnospiraceae bacterium]|nr:M50 family metallopeptidase [Lachnospiraceae bacterium]
MKILVAILMFTFIVFFHELGHFLVAKRCNVRVNEFMIGMGPKIVGVQRGETLYSIRALPLGGACVMEGEDEDSEDERAFNKKPVWQRLLIVFAGPGFNFILAYILSVILLSNVGYLEPYIGEVIEGSAAEEAGLKAGDKIVELNGYNLHFYQEVSMYNYFHNGEETEVKFIRDGEKHTVTLTPRFSEETGTYLMGIRTDGLVTDGDAIDLIKYGFYEIKYQIYITFQSLKYLFTGRAGLNDLAGPVGIVKVIGDTYEEAAESGVYYIVMNMLSFTIMLSANLGVMNLIPFPALDGGRIFIFLIEIVRRKKLPPELEGKINLAGFAILMGFMMVVMFNDIYKLFA